MKQFYKALATVCAIALLIGVVPFSMTATAATTYLFQENFQSYSDYPEDQLPPGWSIYNADGDEYCWYIRTDYDGSVKFVSSSWGDRHADEYLMMPPVTIPSSVEANYFLSFEVYNSYPFGGGEQDRVIIYASETPITDPLTLTDDDVVYDNRFYPGTNEKKKAVANIDVLRGKTVYLAFRHIASRIWTFDLDNIAVYSEEADRFDVDVEADDSIITVTPANGSFEVIDGQDFSFTVTLSDVCRAENGTLTVTANGEELTAANGVYTIKNVTEHQELNVAFRYAAGDVTGDGVVNFADAARLFYQQNGRIAFHDAEKLSGNIDTYATLDTRDLIALLQYIGGMRSYVEENMDASLIWSSDFVDRSNGYYSVKNVDRAAYYLDRREVKDYAATAESRDAKAIFYRSGKARIANYSDGYVFTLPFDNFKADYSLSALRSRYESDDFVLNVSKESSNPYGNTSGSWNTYLTEWINRYIANDTFLSKNELVRTRTTVNSTTLLSGYTVLIYSIRIDNAGDVEMPYYNIAVVRKSTEYVKFHLFVMKSTTDRSATMESIVKTFKEFTPIGISQNEQTAYACEPDRNWNAETKAYYEKLLNQSTTDWGFFTESMSDSTTSYNNLQAEYADLTSRFDYDYEIMPTYTHIGWSTTKHYFPTKMARDFASGNGFNGKPVLQFTYQFTTSNNTGLDAYTPMFDIARGEYDDHFRRLARDIKDYGAPVLFRLNNEMNTDWTSYCGIVTLLDPDLFAITWERLYRIFEEEGVDNCIWIFNPFAKSTPYSSWGEDLCYLPDLDTVHVLGLTAYEMGNDTALTSFEKLYRDLYAKNSPYFVNYPQVISEFGAGAGGEMRYDWGVGGYVSTTLGRNAAKQAAWVEAMFACLAKRDQAGYEFCEAIKGAVWFSVNDYANVNGQDYVTNYFALDDNVSATIAAFKKGLAAHP